MITMKKFMSEDAMKLNALEYRITLVFNYLRLEDIPSEQNYVVLFLLSILKDDLITRDIVSEENDIHENLAKLFLNSEDHIVQQYLPIYQNFEPILKRISSEGLFRIFRTMLGFNRKVFLENFTDIFDNLLESITLSQGRHSSLSFQPVELTRFICAQADLPKKSKVFNPFAGLASFGIFLEEGNEYFGQEINSLAFVLGKLRLMAFDKLESCNYVLNDSILQWPNQSEKFDFILANPPYGMRLSRQYREMELGRHYFSIEHFLIEKGINSLNDNGKLIAVMSTSFLYQSSFRRLRENLINQDLIDTIISLPGGLLLNTGISLIILVINKNKKLAGKVRFINGEKFVETKSSREKVLNDYALNEVFVGNVQDSDVVRVIDNNQIKDNDYSLNVPRYFQPHIEGVKLKEIVQFFRGRRGDLPDKGKVIQIGNLNEDKLDFKLDMSNVDESEFVRSEFRLIEESCLLLTMLGKTLKPTLFEYKGEHVFLNPNILSCKINEEIIDPAYLINELDADYVKGQLASYRQLNTIPRIRQDDLLEIVIKLPSLEEQRAKMQGVLELSDKIKIL